METRCGFAKHVQFLLHESQLQTSHPSTRQTTKMPNLIPLSYFGIFRRVLSSRNVQQANGVVIFHVQGAKHVAEPQA